MLKYLLVLFLLITIPSPAQEKGIDVSEERNLFIKSENHYQEGTRALQDGDYPQAEKHLEAAIKSFPYHADAHYHLSWLAYRGGDYFKALIHIRRAKETFSAYHLLEQQLFQRNKADLLTRQRALQRQILILEAQEDITDFSADKTINNPARAKIIATRRQLLRVEAKLEALTPPPSNIPSDYYLFHGNIFVKLKKLKEARREYKSAIRIDPSNTEAMERMNRLNQQPDAPNLNKKIDQTPGGQDGTY